jgi:NAD(P)-dependent dehydrogenase (short-subunit alcohol dehydrogenase family)
MANQNSDEVRVPGKIALVTGAARGIGRACVLALAEAGADIALGLKNIKADSGLVKEVEALGRKALPLQMDVSRMDEIKAAVTKAVEHFGRIDILINNAGIGGARQCWLIYIGDIVSIRDTAVTGVNEVRYGKVW